MSYDMKMASKSSGLSDSSTDEENDYNQPRKRPTFSFDDSEQQPAKIQRVDSYSESYYSKESEDEAKDDSLPCGTNIKKFYDQNYSTDKSDDDSDVKSQTSYYPDSSLSDYKNNISETLDDSTKEKHEESNELTPASGSIAERMMKKWGFKEGKGLGRELQGISEPVIASAQKGRRGLGLELKELADAQIEFDPEKEIIEVEEKFVWLKNEYEHTPSIEEVTSWENESKVGKRKDTIDGETLFCDEIIVKGIINSKSVFDRLDKNEMREARTRSNPFETIRGSIFLNRAAVKMANMDRACNFMFTKPTNLQPDELLYFADVCAGPGGFSEYVLWKKKWRAKGFGFTLKNENDFKLHDFYAGPCETFHPYYGPTEDGDVYNPQNQTALRDLIMTQTEGEGVHFMMADGGFSVEGQENIQEILSKQLYLCQCLVALMIVRTNGHFVTKVFDLFTPFSAGLVYIMHLCFNHISIFKPNTSRPANSERYLICKEKRPNIEHIVDYLYKVNKRLLKNDKANDILELVPIEKLVSEKNFFEYLKDSNEELGHKQIVGLKKIAAYTENKTLFETRQKTMREQCLKHWGLPDEARIVPRKMNPSAQAQKLLSDSYSILERSSSKDIKLTKQNLFPTILFNEHDWFCMPCSSGENFSNMVVENKATFYLGMGRSQVYKYCKGHWESVRNPTVELPRDTLVYAEMVTEFRKEERSQSKTYSLHILDAFMLGSERIGKHYLKDRLKLVQLFCKALWKPADRSFAPVRVKQLFSITSDLGEKLKLESKTMKNRSTVFGYFPGKEPYENDDGESYYYIPRSIVFFKAIDEPWARHKSSSTQNFYYYNKKNKKSLWEIPDEAKASFEKVIQTQIIWNWPSDESLKMKDFIECLQKPKSQK